MTLGAGFMSGGGASSFDQGPPFPVQRVTKKWKNGPLTISVPKLSTIIKQRNYEDWTFMRWPHRIKLSGPASNSR
jgi:hypothetical protein